MSSLCRYRKGGKETPISVFLWLQMCLPLSLYFSYYTIILLFTCLFLPLKLQSIFVSPGPSTMSDTADSMHFLYYALPLVYCKDVGFI